MPTVVLKRSSVASNAPGTGDLEYGELALNYADGKLYYKTSSNTIDYFSAGDIPTGDIDGVTAGNGLTGGGTTGTVTLNVGAGTGIDVAADSISVDVSDFMTNGSNNRVLTATGTDAMNAEANLTFDGSTLGVTGELTINDVRLGTDSTTLATTTQTAIASFATATYASGKFAIQAKDGVTGEVHITELLIVHDGTTASATEYGAIYTGSDPLASYDVDISSGNVRILATSASTNSTTYKVTETLITA